VPALPRLPGPSQVFGVITTQARALAELPRTLLDLNRSVLGLIEALGSARETMATVAVVTARLERVASELEGPVLALRPGLERLAKILDDDVVDTIPDIVRTINEDVVPLLQGLRDTQSRVNALATVLPGASLLFSRRPPRPAAGDGTVIEPDEN
jgi:hypothetical protein